MNTMIQEHSEIRCYLLSDYLANFMPNTCSIHCVYFSTQINKMWSHIGTRSFLLNTINTRIKYSTHGFWNKQSIYNEHFNDLQGENIYCLEKSRKNSYDFFPYWDDLSLFNVTIFYKTYNLACKCQISFKCIFVALYKNWINCFTCIHHSQ